MMLSILDYISARTPIEKRSIQNTVSLLNQDCSIPFIARYRKEITGDLDEVQIGAIASFKKEFETLEARKLSILKSIEEQHQLTDQLKDQIENCQEMALLEDLYLPYKKSRKTKADTAIEHGLEPLAKIIMAQNATDLDSVAQRYTSAHVSSSEMALEGARHIIAQWIKERLDIRKQLRRQFERYAAIQTKKVETTDTPEAAQHHSDYFNLNEPLARCPSHRLLAILRLEALGAIKIKVVIDEQRALELILSKVLKAKNSCADQIELAAKDAYKRGLYPALAKEALSKAKEKADDTAITVFEKNLTELLLSPPLGEKRILALDPGFKSGCKLVCLDQKGNLLHNETIYPHPPRKEASKAIKKILTLVNAYKIEAIAIGNGTASRETEQLIKRIGFEKPIEVYVVSEAGASVYSASKIARAEFPNYDVTVRGAVSIGRRLSDPLAELVKIEAKSIGVGQYQHDVDQLKLQQRLDRVVERCVNKVGINLNTASSSLLKYVSGIGEKLAENIIEYRTEHGAFTARKDLLKVARLGEKAYEQSAGFLRIKSPSNPLDDSAVHPERYQLVQQMAKDLGIRVEELIGEPEKIDKIPLEHYLSDTVGMLTLKDITAELKKPGLDPRAKARIFEFDPNINSIKDLKPGQILPGIVNNVTNFGCFVDIGIKESGLVHISNLSDSYVSDVNQIVRVQQHVKVKVLEVDIDRRRIQLSMNF